MNIGLPELLVVGILAILLYGERLPEVARSFGKSFSEFKKGLSDVQNEFHAATNFMQESATSTRETARKALELDESDVSTAPKFVPPASEPQPAQDVAKSASV